MKHLALVWAFAFGASAASAEDLAYVNVALRAWLQAIEADAPYLLVDRGAGELRLMHGKAALAGHIPRGRLPWSTAAGAVLA